MLPAFLQRPARALVVGLIALAAVAAARPVAAETQEEQGVVQGLQLALSAQAVVMQGVVDRALGYIGIPYRFGGSHPDKGFDCSGLVNHVFRETLGVTLPRTSRQLATVGVEVAREDMRPGDLVFFNTRGAPNSHVGIYLGDGRFVHAPRARTLVRIDQLDDVGYRGRFTGARWIDPLTFVVATVDPAS